MSSGIRKKILKTGFVLSVICLLGSILLLTQPPTGPYSRIAMILTGIAGLLTGFSLFMQIRQKNHDT